MQKIYFKKTVNLDHQLKELVSISVDESINYKMENSGMRAVGSIMINGEYKSDLERKKFHEDIDLDILAKFEKIIDKREFHVKVEDFDYAFHEGNLSLVIQACIYGVKDDEDRVIETENVKIQQDDSNVADEIEDLLREESIVQNVEEKIIPTIEQIEEPVKTIEKDNSSLSVDVNDDEDVDEDLGTYYLYIVRQGDTYQSIADHYQVDEYKLKDYNHDRPLNVGAIVIVPYYA